MLAFDKINVGCGYDHKPGFLNVDVDPACKPDILLTNNEFTGVPKRHFSHLNAVDVLEHIPRSDSLAVMLEWADLIKPGGTMTLETSSILGLARLLKERPKFVDHHGLTTCLFGNQAHPGDFHYTGFTEASLRTYVLAAGFAIESLVERADWLLLVQARKTSEWADLQDSTLSDAHFVLAAYDVALFREPEEPFTSFHLRNLEGGQSRRALLKQLLSSLERCIRVAQKNDL